MSAGPFSARALAWLAGVVGVCFVLGLVLPVFSDYFDVKSSGSDAFSFSALGHSAFLETLEALDVPVIVSRSHSDEKAASEGMLLVAEPRVAVAGDESFRRLEEMLSFGDVLVVLPKRRGDSWEVKREWVAQTELLEEQPAKLVLEAAVISGEIVRPPAKADGIVWTDLMAGLEPTLDQPQFVRSRDLEPVIAAGDDILLGLVAGEGEHRSLWVLSDPDLIANHGFHRGVNARIAITMIQRIRQGYGAVVTDEESHGFGVSKTIWRALLTFPLVLVTLHAVLGLGLLLWMTTKRFGDPLPPAPPYPPGKGYLIGNTAELLHFGGHTDHALRRYYQTAVRTVAARLHAPPELKGSDLRGWLDRVGRARKVSIDLGPLEERIRATARTKGLRDELAVELASRVHRWRQEMLHGS